MELVESLGGEPGFFPELAHRLANSILNFGANGTTGLEVCRQALAAGHHITAAVRHAKEFPIQDKNLTVVQTEVLDGSSLVLVIGSADPVQSTLGPLTHDMKSACIPLQPKLS